MKKWIMSFVLLLLFTAAAVSAQEGNFVNPEYSQDFIDQQMNLLRNVEKTFPRIVLWETFDGTTKPSAIKLRNNLNMYMMNRAGKREMMMASTQPAQKNDGYGEHHFDITGAFSNFYLSVDVQILEQDEGEHGYLWIQYTDGDIVGSEARSAGEIDFPVSIHMYDTGPEGQVSKTFYDLSAYRNDYGVHKIEMIRLDGLTNVYIDGRFLIQFADHFSGRFYQLYGAGLKAGGTYVTGQFDNLIVRFQSY